MRALFLRHAYEPARCDSYAEKLNRALQLDPSLVAAHVESARLHLHLFNSNSDPSPGRREMAVQAIERAEAIAPGAAETRAIRVIYRLTAGGETEAAWPELQALARELPADNTLQVHFVRTCHRLGRWAESLQALRQLVRREATSPIPRQLLGYTLFHLRDYTDAAAWGAEAAKLDGTPLFRRLAAIWYGWLSDPEPARVLSEIRALPESPQRLRQVQWCESQVLLSEHRFAEALAAYRDSVKDTGSAMELIDGTVYVLRLERWAGDPAAPQTEAKLRRLLAPGRQKAHQHPYDLLVGAYARAVLGRTDEALALADEAVEACGKLVDAIATARVQGANEFYSMPGRLVILALCDARERFFAEFERLLDVPAALDIRYLAMDPTFDVLRSDPRFDRLLAAAPMPIRLPGPAR